MADEQNPSEEGPSEDPTEESPRRGEMREQDPDTTTPRGPTVAEKRARKKAAAEKAERERAEAEAARRKEMIKKRVMIGGGVTVGVAALVAAYYASKPEEVTATCVGPNGDVAKNEQVCSKEYVENNGGHVGAGGLLFLPIPGGGFHSYHYNYGGTVHNGHVNGGSKTKPGNAHIKTHGGKTIQRGGFGVGRGGSGS